MKNMRFGVITASLVLIPPIIGSIAYFAPFRDGAGFFFVNYLYIASASLLWWPFSRIAGERLKLRLARTFAVQTGYAYGEIMR